MQWTPTKGQVIHRRSKHGWTGEVIGVSEGDCKIFLLPDKYCEKNPPTQTWPLSDCKPSEITPGQLATIAKIREAQRAQKQPKAKAVVSVGHQIELGGQA